MLPRPPPTAHRPIAFRLVMSDTDSLRTRRIQSLIDATVPMDYADVDEHMYRRFKGCVTRKFPTMHNLRYLRSVCGHLVLCANHEFVAVTTVDNDEDEDVTVLLHPPDARDDSALVDAVLDLVPYDTGALTKASR